MCTARGRWWVVINPTHLYDQADFKSRDVALTFHIGLMLRMQYNQEREVPVAPEVAELLPGSWRRWQQAFEAYDSGDEAETFQSVGVRLRECLVSFVGETRNDDLVPEGTVPPEASDFKGWNDLLANRLAAGESAARLRSYLKKLAVETWEYVNWLTHAKNAIRMDAEIGLKAVEHLLGTFSAARLRLARTPQRCESCGSCGVVAGVCRHCEWADPSYVLPEQREWSEEERARRNRARRVRISRRSSARPTSSGRCGGAMASCAFCGFTGKLTGEHVFGDWLTRIGLDLEPVEHGAGPLNRIGRSFGAHPPFRQKVKDVCADCNNGDEPVGSRRTTGLDGVHHRRAGGDRGGGCGGYRDVDAENGPHGHAGGASKGAGCRLWSAAVGVSLGTDDPLTGDVRRLLKELS